MHEVDLLAGARRDAAQRPAQIVGDLEQLAGEAGDRVFVRLLDLAGRAAAQVLGLGQRPQQALLGRLELGRELGLARRAPRPAASRAGAAGSVAASSGAARSAAGALGGFRRFEVLGSSGLIHRLNSCSELPRRRETTRAV